MPARNLGVGLLLLTVVMAVSVAWFIERRVTEVMLAELIKLQERFACLGDVRGLGLVFGLELVKSRVTMADW